MRRIATRISPGSASYRAYRAHNLKVAEAFRARQAAARFDRPDRDRQRLARQDKQMPRERLEQLLDPGTPFLEFSSLAAKWSSTAATPP